MKRYSLVEKLGSSKVIHRNLKHYQIRLSRRERSLFQTKGQILREILEEFRKNLVVPRSLMKSQSQLVRFVVFHTNPGLLMKNQSMIVLLLALLAVCHRSLVMKMMNLEMRQYLMIRWQEMVLILELHIRLVSFAVHKREQIHRLNQNIVYTKIRVGKQDHHILPCKFKSSNYINTFSSICMHSKQYNVQK